MSDAPTSVPASSRWEDIVDVFIAPVQLFRRRADGRFGFALLLLVVLTTAMFFGTRPALQPIMDAELAKGTAAAVKKNPNLTPEQIEQYSAMGRKITPVFIALYPLVAAFVLGAALWAAARAVGGRLGYAQSATIVTFALFPRIVEGIINAVQALLMDEGRLTSRLSVSLGLGRFLDPGGMNPYLFALLGRVDLFTLWVTVLIAVGVKQIAKTTTGQAVAAAAIVWLVGALPVLYQAMTTG